MIIKKTRTTVLEKHRISSNTKRAQNPTSFSQCCASLTWWSWRGGRTRSHSEHGRETPLRQWYFVLRRGRVGRCQVCKTQLKSSLCIYYTAHAVTKGRSQSGLSCLVPWCHMTRDKLLRLVSRNRS